jgi:hypothetical protein
MINRITLKVFSPWLVLRHVCKVEHQPLMARCERERVFQDYYPSTSGNAILHFKIQQTKNGHYSAIRKDAKVGFVVSADNASTKDISNILS